MYVIKFRNPPMLLSRESDISDLTTGKEFVAFELREIALRNLSA